MASAEEPGEIRVKLSNLAESKNEVVHTFHTLEASQGAKTPTGETFKALPELPGSPKRAARIIFDYVPDAADTVESEESSLIYPVLLYNEKTRQVERSKTLTLNDIEGFKPADTVDKVGVAGQVMTLGYYDAPTGYSVMLAAGKKFHAYIGDDTA